RSAAESSPAGLSRSLQWFLAINRKVENFGFRDSLRLPGNDIGKGACLLCVQATGCDGLEQIIVGGHNVMLAANLAKVERDSGRPRDRPKPGKYLANGPAFALLGLLDGDRENLFHVANVAGDQPLDQLRSLAL